MRSKIRLTLGALAAFPAILALCSTPAHAGYVYIGSWTVDEGPSWTTDPPAYSGVEAAALLFGGSPGNYVTSTVDSNPGDINFLSWVSTWGGGNSCGGFPCGTQVADTFVQSTGGFYLNAGDTSAYVNDWAGGSEFTNYAFSSVPELSTWAMLGLGFAGLAFAGQKGRRPAATVA